MKTRKLAFGALISASAVGLLAVGSLLPTMRLALSAMAGLAVSLVVMRHGIAAAWMSFAVSAGLALLLLPSKDCAVYYTVFFGWYPIVKSLCERLSNLILEWLGKLASLNGALVVLFLLFTLFVPENLRESRVAAFAWIAANGVFVVYDLGLGVWIFRLRTLLNTRN